jgi:DNA/RNA endonuclease G (NUC1)
LRGKVASLKFELIGGGTVYLDNVFFKSQHLLFGNPTLNGQESRSNVSINANNFLIEKPQYAASYNSENKGANWVSWQLNNSWLGNLRRPGEANSTPDYPYSPRLYPWATDTSLPDGLPVSSPTDYNVASPFGYDRGHLVPSSQRNRSLKDQIATFLTTNLLSQEGTSNEYYAWNQFESFSEELVESRGWELYTIAGGAGSLEDDTTAPPPALKTQFGINTPNWFWKVVVALRPGQGLNDITVDTPVIALNVPNYRFDPIEDDPDVPNPRLWSTWITSVDNIESLTKLDLLSNLPDQIEETIEAKYYSGSIVAGNFPLAGNPFAHLLAEQVNVLEETPNPSTIWQNGILKDSFFSSDIFNSFRKFNNSLAQIDVSQIGTSEQSQSHDSSAQIGITQVCSTQRTCSQISSTQISPTQISIDQKAVGYNGTTQISSTQIGSLKPSTSQVSVTQVGSAQISSIEVCSKQDSTTQVNSWNLNIFKIDTPIKTNSTEVPLTSSITLQQFLSSHNYDLQNTTVPTWTQLIQGTTPFNLNIEITDLPTGQLAEASLTGYASNGRPNSGTLTLDLDGNGLGWFIDTTPWESSEFGVQSSD